MNIFDFRSQLIGDYASYIKSFIQIRDPQIRNYVQQKLQEGVLWPEPLIQLNPLFERGESIDELVGVSISKPAFCTLNDLSQNARRGMPSLRRVEPKNSGLSSFYCGKDESLPQELVGESFLAILTV